MSRHYTATLIAANTTLSKHSSNNYQELLITLLNQIELCNTGTYGRIVDNKQRRIIHRCRKSHIE